MTEAKAMSKASINACAAISRSSAVCAADIKPTSNPEGPR